MGVTAESVRRAGVTRLAGLCACGLPGRNILYIYIYIYIYIYKIQRDSLLFVFLCTIWASGLLMAAAKPCTQTQALPHGLLGLWLSV